VTWTRHFVYRAVQTRTTWKFRIGLTSLIVLAAWLTSGWWMAAIARSLVCDSSGAPSDAILIENFDPGYLPFERARQLRTAGMASRVLVPVPRAGTTSEMQPVQRALSEVLASMSRLGDYETVPFREVEPISLNAARDIQRFLEQEHIRSVIIVSPLFRSRRSQLVYEATLGRAGIVVRCEPGKEPHNINSWTDSWHRIQNVAEQWVKLQYYRFYVLPFHAGS